MVKVICIILCCLLLTGCSQGTSSIEFTPTTVDEVMINCNPSSSLEFTAGERPSVVTRKGNFMAECYDITYDDYHEIFNNWETVFDIEPIVREDCEYYILDMSSRAYAYVKVNDCHTGYMFMGDTVHAMEYIMYAITFEVLKVGEVIEAESEETAVDTTETETTE